LDVNKIPNPFEDGQNLLKYLLKLRTKMRIGIQAWGSEGDIRPLLALAGGLS
jgi:hypothetical protein